MDFEIVYLTKEHIYMVHQNSIVEFGGEHGIFDYTDNRIDSILHQQYPIFGVDRYPSIFDKAAMLLYFFTKGHCFVDGNKRVGYQSTMVFLKVNGYEDITCEDDGYKQTLIIAKSKIPDIDREQYIKFLSVWLYNRFARI